MTAKLIDMESEDKCPQTLIFRRNGKPVLQICSGAKAMNIPSKVLRFKNIGTVWEIAYHQRTNSGKFWIKVEVAGMITFVCMILR